MRQNRVPDRRQLDGDVLLVGVESQAVWLWGVRDKGDNPLVWERENEPGADWTETAERLDEFLWHFTLAEAVLGGCIGAGVSDVNAADVARFTSAWTALDVKPWRWPGPDQALWSRGGALAWTVANDRPDSPVTDASTYSILVGARSKPDLAVIDDSGITWAGTRPTSSRRWASVADPLFRRPLKIARFRRPLKIASHRRCRRLSAVGRWP